MNWNCSLKSSVSIPSNNILLVPAKLVLKNNKILLLYGGEFMFLLKDPEFSKPAELLYLTSVP